MNGTKQTYKENKMKDWIIMFIAIVVLVIGICSVCYVVAKKIKAASKICHPYSVLTGYELDGKEYVICGNKEHRELKTRRK